jgi:NADH-quinone oxidoreductase subunit N
VILFFGVSKEIKNSVHKNEHITLMLGLTGGAFLMASAVNLLMMYLSLELASLSSYVLAGYSKRDKRSSEASMKYIIYGAASSGIMLFGITILYGFTGSLDLFKINQFISSANANNPAIIISIIMILAGIGYKISSVPFQFWTPDVYEGAPIPVAAFLSVTSSAAGMAMLIRFLLYTFVKVDANGSWAVIASIKWNEIIIVASIASMLLGNMVALWQSSIKRLLAYSSIAHTGYMLLGLTVLNQMGITAILIYFGAYLFMNLGAFYVVILISNKLKTDDIGDMAGIGFRAPVIGVAMAIFMFSLSGIPSTIGFIGKFYIFSTLIKADMAWLALVAMINSVISLFFYVKVLKVMFFAKNRKSESKITYSFSNYLILALFVIPVMFFGLYFTPLLKLAESSASMFGFK